MDPERPKTTVVVLNYDILTEIFKTFNDSDTGPTDPHLRLKQQLYRAALTCQAFRDAALDSLWKCMDTIEPLLRLLPTVEIFNGAYTICNPIKDSDQAIFDSYSRKIRVFALRYNQPSISPFTLSRLQFLPRLRKFVCQSLSELMSFNAPFLLSHTLDTIDLQDVSTDPRNVQPFMHALQQIAPDLKRIIIRSTSSAQTWKDLLVFRHLRSLQLTGVIDLPLFRQLAALPELRELVIDMTNSSPLLVYADPAAMIRIAFTNLKSLSLSGDIFAIASYFLHMEGGAITDVSIISQSWDDQNAPNQSLQDPWTLCLSVLAYQWADSLRYLSLRTNDPVWTQLSTTPEFYTSMSNLQLASLRIESQLSLRQCEQLAPSIPNVRDLRVAFVQASEDRSSLEVLDILSRYCLHMTTLDTHLAGNSTNPSSIRTSAYRPHKNLKKLIVGSDDSASLQNLHAIFELSKCIDRIFPYLESIEPSEDSVFWRHVSEIVRGFGDVRRSIPEQKTGTFERKGKGKKAFTD